MRSLVRAFTLMLLIVLGVFTLFVGASNAQSIKTVFTAATSTPSPLTARMEPVKAAPLTANMRLIEPGPLPTFVVVNTGGLGLLLRSAPTIYSPALETLPDNLLLTSLEDKANGTGHLWYRVLAPSGQQGWVAAEYVR